jgi:hypothetical protein
MPHLDDQCPVCNLWMPGQDHERAEEEVVVCARCTELVHRGCLETEIGEMCKTCWDKEPDPNEED